MITLMPTSLQYLEEGCRAAQEMQDNVAASYSCMVSTPITSPYGLRLLLRPDLQASNNLLTMQP